MAPTEKRLICASWRTMWTMLGISLVLTGCPKKGSELPDDPHTRRPTEIESEKCAVDSKAAEKGDANEDGKAELVRVMEGDREACRAVDLNFDGVFDRTTFFDESGRVRRVESDFDRDGRIDEIALYENGVLQEKHRATTMDGKLDTWEFYAKGELKTSERDENGDGVVDQWWEYPQRGCPLIHVDTDGDGRPDPGASIDYCKETGYSPPAPPPRTAEADVDYGDQTGPVEEVSNVSADQDQASGESNADGEQESEEGAQQ